jgi:hypothetical protein
MLTVGGVSSSGPGLLTEIICLGIAGTIAETERIFGGGSVYTSTGIDTGKNRHTHTQARSNVSLMSHQIACRSLPPREF